MITAGARFRSARVTVFVVLALGLWPANGGAGLPLKPISIVVYAGQSVFPGAQVELFFGRVGERSYMEAILSVEAQPGPCPVCDFAGRYPTDIYVGAIRPDGQFASWIGNPQAPTVVIGAVPVPLVVNVDLVEKSQTATRLDFGRPGACGAVCPLRHRHEDGQPPFRSSLLDQHHFYPFLLVPR